MSVAELRTVHGALEHRQLLTECKIFERDRSASTANPLDGSEQDVERSQHELSCPESTSRSTRAGDLILANNI
jgi:hypothetical protein